MNIKEKVETFCRETEDLHRRWIDQETENGTLEEGLYSLNRIPIERWRSGYKTPSEPKILVPVPSMNPEDPDACTICMALSDGRYLEETRPKRDFDEKTGTNKIVDSEVVVRYCPCAWGEPRESSHGCLPSDRAKIVLNYALATQRE